MENLINHLPQSKRDELKNVVAVVCQNCKDVEKIILFGSYARGDYKEAKDLKENRRSGHISDYDILVVTSKKETAVDSMLWKRISEACKNLNLSAYPKIITHDIEALNIKLAEAQYFYSDIKKEGILLYDTGKHKLADKRELTGSEKQRIAQDHFASWFKSARTFFCQYENAIKMDDYKNAAFQLHQSVESAYKSILLVFTNYNPNEHFLEILGRMSEDFHPELRNIFPQNTEEEEDRFQLFEYAYIGGRYDPNYYISKEDLEILAKYVQKLLTLTEGICKEEIESFVA